MIFKELHEILDDENKKLSPAELRQVIYELKQDCFNETAVLLDDYINGRCGATHYHHTNGYLLGEQNAFQIVLDLLEHLNDAISLPYLLCTSSKFACVIWRDADGKVHKTYTMPIHEEKCVLEEKRRIQWKD